MQTASRFRFVIQPFQRHFINAKIIYLTHERDRVRPPTFKNNMRYSHRRSEGWGRGACLPYKILGTTLATPSGRIQRGFKVQGTWCVPHERGAMNVFLSPRESTMTVREGSNTQLDILVAHLLSVYQVAQRSKVSTPENVDLDFTGCW